MTLLLTFLAILHMIKKRTYNTFFMIIWEEIYMKDLYSSTFTNGETSFSISILETGWIYNVSLIITDKMRMKYKEHEFKRIEAHYCGKNTINKKTFSVFSASYWFEFPVDTMVAFFLYTIADVTYMTDPMYFSVQNE